jgi:hypothetical protein
MTTTNIIHLLPRMEVGPAAIRAMTAIGIHTLNDLARFTEWEVIAIHGMSPETFGALKRALTSAGLSFAGMHPSLTGK